jgi:pimeloyl-ACP methyl ester carboxylesterase/class 3 adenylate cyclase
MIGMLDPSEIETRYAKSGDVNIAYQVFGGGAVNLVYVPGWTSNVEYMWALPENHRFLDRLATFARVVVLDRRGTGLSDPVDNPPTLEERMDDVRAVMDAVGWQCASICGVSEGGPMSMLFAATYPRRTTSLVLCGTFARFSRDHDYPQGYSPRASERWLAVVESTWGTGETSKVFAPTRADDPAFVRALGRFERMAMSPRTAHKLFRLLTEVDVRHVLSAIRVPTLILHRVGDVPIAVSHGRYLAEHIEGAKYVELPGADHFPCMGDTDALVSELCEFLTGERVTPEADRVLATILFCDIVDSTRLAAELGDREWSTMLSRFHTLAEEKVKLFGGRRLDTAGDGLFASFDGPARAVRCGTALCAAAESLGAKLRVGVHTGECEVFGDKFSGIAVHVGARVAAASEPGQVLVTSTVKELVVGSGIRFADLGPRTLKGVPDEWRLYRALT